MKILTPFLPNILPVLISTTTYINAFPLKMKTTILFNHQKTIIMKNNIHFLAIFVVFFAFSNFINAQDDQPTTYHVLSYMKVESGMHQDYIKLEKAWKKIHQAQIKAGTQNQWVLDRVISPSGANAEYNYITRQSFKGEAQLGNHMEGRGMPENWKTLLTPDEIKLVERTDKIRTWVKTEVWSSIDGVSADDYKKAKIHVFNFFDSPEGKRLADHIRVETDIWKPIHEARVKNDQAKGWFLIQKEFPFGSQQNYDSATVDVYESIEQMMSPTLMKTLKEVHPDKKMEDIMKETAANSDLISGEIRMQLDRTE